MPRTRRLIVVLALLLAPSALAAPVGATASAAVREIEPPSAFRRQIRAIKRHTRIAVLLPETLAIDVPNGHGVEVKWAANRRTWSLSLGIGPRCGGANACFVGEFTATRGAKPAFTRRVRLHGGVTGFFKPSTCGASCSPPQLLWRVGNVLYDLQLRAAGRASDRAELVAIADSALAAGPR
jgi:hypothetical protein